MTFPADQAEWLIRDRVKEVPQVMGMSVQPVQSYLDPARLAESVAATFGEELPGEDVLGLPRDVLLSVAVVGRCVAGLAEAINVRSLHVSPPGGADSHRVTDRVDLGAGSADGRGRRRRCGERGAAAAGAGAAGDPQP